MIEYKVETIKDCLEEMKPLLLLHYKEVAMYQDKIELDPDYDKYLSYEDLGMIHLVTVREDGELVGYHLSTLINNLHYKQDKYAVNDILYIKESLRNSKVGLEMFKYAEETLKEEGVSVMTVHMKTALPFDSLCEGLDYDYAERIYTKYIGGK